jgi:thiamine pyrophosphate-dependent acetolactate synthase large subunit-like protein
MHTVSHAIADEVRAQVSVTFGLMGNGNAYFLDGLVRGGGRLVPVRHEVASIAAADTYFRVSGSVACASVTYGAGFTNILTALTEARMARSPMVVVVGDQPTSGARPWDVDQVALAAAAGVQTLTVGVDNAGTVTREAFELARRERVPVVLAIPYNLAAVPAPLIEPVEISAETLAPEPVEGRQAQGPALGSDVYLVVLDALCRAERPLILAGRGARECASELAELADQIGALTATTAVAKGTFAGRDTDLGVCGGFAAAPNAEAIAEADVVLVIGAGLNQFTRAFGHAFDEGANVIQIDIADAPTDDSVGHFLRGDASQVVSRLLADLEPTDRREWQMRSMAATGHRVGSEFASDGLLDPSALTVRLNDLVPGNRVVVQDGGHFSSWIPMYWDFPTSGRVHMVGTAFQTIGLGTGAAAGGAVAAADAFSGATTVLATGDGGLLMCLSDLETLVRESTSMLVIVYNDGAYGAEIHQYGSRGVHEGPMAIGGVDFARAAEAVGAHGRIIHTLDDLEVVNEWVEMGARGTLLLDCRISPKVIAPYMYEIVAVASAAEARNAAQFGS